MRRSTATTVPRLNDIRSCVVSPLVGTQQEATWAWRSSNTRALPPGCGYGAAPLHRASLRPPLRLLLEATSLSACSHPWLWPVSLKVEG